MKKENWDCNDCNKFIWWSDRPATKEEMKIPEIEDLGYVSINPKTENDWKKAQLYNGDNEHEMTEINDFFIEDFCKSCQKKLKKLKVFI